jgi:hypothetical protein
MPALKYKGLPSTGWHTGELQAQEALGWAGLSGNAYSYVEDHLDRQHSDFHSSLNFMPLATLDADARPWAAFLCGADGERGFISAKDRYTLQIRAGRVAGDPTFDNLRTSSVPLVAGVGVELLNRRRNKFGGYMRSIEEAGEEEILLDLQVNSALGNCPVRELRCQWEAREPLVQKYINVRELAPRPRGEVRVLEQNDKHDPTQPLPQLVLDFISKVDSAYVATAYLPEDQPDEAHLGMNHRGGRPGYLRVDPVSQAAIYLPDYSGNRLMMSVGNMLSCPRAGLALPDWSTGDVLYVTGNVTTYLGLAAKDIMRSVHGITKLEVTGYRLVQQALPLVQKGDTIWSEYNPPVRFLNAESASGFGTATGAAQATLSAFRPLGDGLATLTFKTSGFDGASYKPGQYAILDCSSLLNASARKYKHMAARGQEQTLNE